MQTLQSMRRMAAASVAQLPRHTTSRSIVDFCYTYDDVVLAEEKGDFDYWGEPLVASNDNLDSMMMTGENLLPRSRFFEYFNLRCGSKIWKRIHIKFWVVMMLLGGCMAVTSTFFDFFLTKANGYRLHKDAADGTIDISMQTNPGWMFGGIVLMLCARFAAYMAPCAAGSGIPEIKGILSGSWHTDDFLSFRTLLAKPLGLWAGLCAGLPLGKMGPFVHIGACFAFLICAKIKCFNEFLATSTDRTRLMAAAVGAGVTATFCAPIGAMLFTVEITTTFFFVHNIWRSFFCSVFCMLCLRCLQSFHISTPFNETHLAEPPLNEIPHFTALGILCGAMGGALVTACQHVMRMQKFFTRSRTFAILPTFMREIVYVALVAVFCTSIAYKEPSVANIDRVTINALFSRKPLSRNVGSDSEDWVICLALILIKSIGCCLALSCPIPAGVFTPVFVLGAASGRLFGMLISETVAEPALYAVVGAAALTAGVTRTISVCVIVFELTGQINHMGPVMMAVCVAYATNAAISPPIFDVILHLRKMAFLPHVRHPRIYSRHTAGTLAKRIPDACKLPVAFDGELLARVTDSHLMHYNRRTASQMTNDVMINDASIDDEAWSIPIPIVETVREFQKEREVHRVFVPAGELDGLSCAVDHHDEANMYYFEDASSSSANINHGSKENTIPLLEKRNNRSADSVAATSCTTAPNSFLAASDGDLHTFSNSDVTSDATSTFSPTANNNIKSDVMLLPLNEMKIVGQNNNNSNKNVMMSSSSNHATAASSSSRALPSSFSFHRLHSLLYLDPENGMTSRIEDSPFVVPQSLGLKRVHFLFVMLSLNHLFVVDPMDVKSAV